MWLYTALYGCVWPYLAVYGCICLHRAVHGCISLYMCVHDCTWSGEEALDLMARLRAHPTINTVALRHVYREYNADADGACNQVLDLLLESAGARQVQVNWDSFCDVDQDGDTMMQLV